MIVMIQKLFVEVIQLHFVQNIFVTLSRKTKSNFHNNVHAGLICLNFKNLFSFKLKIKNKYSKIGVLFYWSQKLHHISSNNVNFIMLILY